MSVSYTYKPEELSNKGVSRARFELGDTMVDGGAETCMLSDQEIQAVIDSSKRWKEALYRLADGVCMRLSFETDWKNDGTSFSLSQRADRWIALRDKLKASADISASMPTSGAVMDSIKNARDGGHYFHGGMMENPHVQPAYPYKGGEDK